MTASPQIKGNKYYCVLKFKDTSGQWRTKWIKTGLSVDGNNKRRVKQKCIEAIQDYKWLESLVPTDILFSDYMIKWLETKARYNVSVSTYENYSSVIRGVIAPYFAERKIKLKNLQYSDLEAFYHSKLRNPNATKEENTGKVSASTIHHYQAYISKALKAALKDSLIRSNPAELVELPKRQKAQISFYEPHEMKTLLCKSKGSDIECVVMIGAYFGLRRGEIIGLRWDSIDFEKGTLTINGTMDAKNRFKPEAKTNASVRTLVMPDYAASYLQTLKASQEQQRTELGERYNQQWIDYVCVKSNGDLLTCDYVSRAFPQLLAECSLKKIRLHDLRHSLVSLLANDGLTSEQIKAWSGHSSTATTADIYTHIYTGIKAEMAQSIDRQLAN